MHKLLEKQLIRHLDKRIAEMPELDRFIKAVNDSYESFDRDRELSAHAFKISEFEYQEVNESLRVESELKKQSIQKLKIALSKITDDELIEFQGDDLLAVSDYLNSQILKRKIADTALKLSEEKYRGIIANMNLGLIEVDLDDNIQMANQSFLRMSGYAMEELIGKSAARLFTDEEHQKLIFDKNEARMNGKGDAYEVPVKDKSGQLKWWLISGAPKINSKGEIEGTIGIHLDITEQKSQEEDLRQARIVAEEASKSKDAFMANMSHEIRTPLNGITGMLRKLAKSGIDDSQKFYINNAEVASRHLISIVNNILDISKIEAGEFELDEIDFNLKDTVNETTRIISTQANDKGLAVAVNIDGNLCETYIGDSRRIRQIILNLMGNAIKFTEKGEIIINCKLGSKNGEHHLVILEIIDTGIGINEEYLTRIFQKFSQEDRSTARKYGGTGLGMAITYELVHLMKGVISVQSKKSEGTKITIELPLIPTENLENPISSDRLNFDQLRGIRVLLVEDNEFNRMVAGHTLSVYDISITEASNGQEAVEKVKEGKFDLILMDIQMPILDGFEATKVIREELNCSTPIIAFTANAFNRETKKCLAAGMNDFIVKPYDEAVFFSTLVKNLKVVELKPSKPKLYDLTQVEKIAKGDGGFVRTVLQLFLDQLPSAIGELSMGIQLREISIIKTTVHRIKPSLANLGVASAAQIIQELEYADNLSVEQSCSKTKEVITILKALQVELKGEI